MGKPHGANFAASNKFGAWVAETVMQQVLLEDPRSNTRIQRGFTLVELMIVLVIVGILTSIAYPSYVEYMRRAKRAEAKALISDVSARLERYFFDNNKYTLSMSDLGFPAGLRQGESAERNYGGSVGAGPSGSINTSHMITANIKSSRHQDPKCGNLTLDSRGAKGASGAGTDAAAIAECWR